MNLTEIPQAEQEGVIGSFWTMLQECERSADDRNDPVLKEWVSQWYGQWNRITGDKKAPRWAVPTVEFRGGRIFARPLE